MLTKTYNERRLTGLLDRTNQSPLLTMFEAQPRALLASLVLSKLPVQLLDLSTYAQLKHELIVL